jgi:hypothetical protein
MKIAKVTPTKTDLSVPLGNLKAGDVFRFAFLTFDEALKEDAFYLVMEAPEKKDGTMVVNLSDGRSMLRDKEHRVVRHNTQLNIFD